jgi:hypothetical protein
LSYATRRSCSTRWNVTPRASRPSPATDPISLSRARPCTGADLAAAAPNASFPAYRPAYRIE